MVELRVLSHEKISALILFAAQMMDVRRIKLLVKN